MMKILKRCQKKKKKLQKIKKETINLQKIKEKVNLNEKFAHCKNEK